MAARTSRSPSWYFSKTTGDWRRALVYTPPGYDSDPKQRYPVLLLQHGAGENETGWTRQGRTNFILDNPGVHVVYVESPGAAHEWQTWRRALNDFAPRLFH